MKKKELSARAIVAVCSLVYFVSYFSRKDFAAAMAEMIADGVIDKPLGGYISMAMFVLYGVGQLVSGFLGDRLPPAYLLTAGLITTSLTNLLMPILPAGAMIPLWAVNGFAQAMLWPPIVRILADNLSSEGFVRANLVVTCAAHLSTVLLYLYVPLCILVASWKMAFFTASLIALLAGLAVIILATVFVLGDKRKREDTDAPVSNSTAKKDNNYLHLAVVSGLPTIFVAIICMGFLRDGIETWLPTLLSEAFGMNAGRSILISVLLPVFAAVAIAVITVLHKTRLFTCEVLGSLVIFVGSVAVTLMLSFTVTGEGLTAKAVTLVLACLVSAAMHAVNFLYISCLPRNFAKYNRAATTSGICNAFTYVGAAISMYTISTVSERFGWPAVMISWCAVALVGAILSLLSLKRYSIFIRKDDTPNE
ncbi:MAG: MFS transporter [Clostridia bacterium]|nr:MFS transporter [Clostridia bacterium]